MSTTGIWPPLHDDTKQGDPVAKIRGDEYARICRVLNTIQIVGGTLVKTASGKDWMLIIDNTIYDFDPRFDGENIYRTAGHRCIIGLHDDWELLDEVPVTLTEDGNGTYWMRWVYTTDEAPGSFTEGYGTPPTQDTTCTVALLWTITDGVVKYHERGAKRFFDWDKC